jgi:integrase/recombinase XerC
LKQQPQLAGRDLALIGLMVYSFTHVSAALGMKVEDVYNEHRRLRVHLREKSGKRHEMLCHHNQQYILTEHISKAPPSPMIPRAYR